MIYLTELPLGVKGLEHAAAWALLAHALHENAHQVDLAHSLRFGPHGKPYLSGGPFFSLSHTRGLVLCALEDWETRRSFSPAVRKRVFSPEECLSAAKEQDDDDALTVLWTLKESYMKFTGRGLGQKAITIQFRFADDGLVLLEGGAYFDHTDWKGFHIAQCGPAPFHLSLCPVALSALDLPPEAGPRARQ